MTNHPLQPIFEVSGVLRFKKNQIVEYLFRHGGIDMEELNNLHFTREDKQQFVQLLGDSVDGFLELSHVDNDIRTRIDLVLDDSTDNEAYIKMLEQKLNKAREKTKKLVKALFSVSVDDLEI